MYIHRAILSLLLVLYVFTPSIQAWVLESGAAWYRPYIAWAVVIFTTYLLQRRMAKKA